MGENLSIKELLSTYAVQGTGHEKTNNTQTPMESSWYGQQLGVQTELPLITLFNLSLSQLICVKIWSNNPGKLYN